MTEIKSKILISGTGRAGTTFLIKIFSFLGFDTGFNESNYINYISKNCNAGMEFYYTKNHYILKNPTFITEIPKIIDSNINIEYMIIPIRDYNKSAKSRVKNGIDLNNTINGGTTGLANDEDSQVLYYNKIMSEYLYYMVKYDIPTIFIDFQKMILDKLYLYNKLKVILDKKDISIDNFNKYYDIATESSKPKNLNKCMRIECIYNKHTNIEISNTHCCRTCIEYNTHGPFCEKKYNMSVVILTRFKNEGHILYEWINHHLLEGVDKIFLIDHKSSDDYLNKNLWMNELIIKDKIQILNSQTDDQNNDYSYFLNEVKKHEWVILIDIDEFIFTPQPNITLKDILNNKFYDIDYIKIRWKMFTHQDKFQPKSIIENNTFTHSNYIDITSLSEGIKCIAKTKDLKKINIHSMEFNKEIKTIFLSDCHNEYIQINHYRTQSDEYLYGVKEIRGGGLDINKYKNFINHKRDIYDKNCTKLKNKRLNLINQLNNKEQVRPQIYEESSFYNIINPNSNK